MIKPPSSELVNFSSSISATTSSARASSINDNTSDSRGAPLREDLIQSAVSFLSSSSLHSADTTKKVAFLHQKGLMHSEIDEAFRRVQKYRPAITTTEIKEMSAAGSGASSSGGSDGPPSYYPLIMYYDSSPPPAPMLQIMRNALGLSFGIVGISSLAVQVIKYFICPILGSIAAYRSHRYRQYAKGWDGFFAKYLAVDDQPSWIPAVVDAGPQQQPRVISQLTVSHKDLADSLERLVELARERVRTMEDGKNRHAPLKEKLTDLKQQVEYLDFVAIPEIRNNPSVQNLNSELRDLKGMMLNSSHLETPPPSPAAPVEQQELPYHPRRRSSSFRGRLKNVILTKGQKETV